MARHGPLYPLRQQVRPEMLRLAGNVSIAGHVAIAIVLYIAVDHLIQRPEGGNVGVWLGINDSHLRRENIII